MFFYAGVSLAVMSVTGYGAAISSASPALVLRRRYTIYHAMKTIDAAERPLAHVSAAALATTTVDLLMLGSIVFVYVALTGVILVGGLIAAIPRRRTVVRETLTTQQPTRPTPGCSQPVSPTSSPEGQPSGTARR